LGQPTTFTVSGCTLTRNYAYSAGAVYVTANSLVTIADCDISENSGSDDFSPQAGAIWNKGDLTITNSTVTNNRVGSVYAKFGIAIRSSNTCLIEDSLIANNNDGGWIIFDDSDSTIEVSSSSTSFVMRNCTVAFNGPSSPRQDALRVRSSGPALVENCIIRGNGGAAIHGNATVNYSCIEGGWSGAGTGNTDARPLFVNPVTGRFDLQPGSPCIDAGDPRARPTGVDFDGNPRVLDGRLDRVQRLDMGYVEFANVHLGAAVNPSHELLLSTPSSTAGLTLFLLGALGPGEASFAPWGRLLVDPGTLGLIEAIGTTPTRQTYAIPPSLFGTDVVLQLLALGAPLGGGGRPGNFSNAVALTLE
jgi:hypothetical protein